MPLNFLCVLDSEAGGSQIWATTVTPHSRSVARIALARWPISRGWGICFPGPNAPPPRRAQQVPFKTPALSSRGLRLCRMERSWFQGEGNL
jgi:hypothetical protein